MLGVSELELVGHIMMGKTVVAEPKGVNLYRVAVRIATGS